MASLEKKENSSRTGIHTILWGRAPEKLRRILQYIREVGFSGVEVFQHPDHIREQFGTAGVFGTCLRELGLELIGLCSGTLEERVRFCEEGCLQPAFLYVDQFDPYIDEAIRRGFTVAFHPHAYKQTNPGAVLKRALEYPGLKVVLDPAHLVVMNLDPIDTLRDVAPIYDEPAFNQLTSQPKLVAVHFKDWGMWYGRSFQRYAQGFTDLGAGDVPLADFAAVLTSEVSFEGWYIIEQDHLTDTADRCVKHAARWLNDNIPGVSLSELEIRCQSVQFPSPCRTDITLDGERVLHTIVRSQETPDVFWSQVVSACQEWLHCPVVSLWEHTPAMNQVSVLAAYPDFLHVEPMKISDSLAGMVIDTKVPRFIPDVRNVPGRKFSDLRIADEYNLRSCYSVPIWNSHNPNDVEAVLNLYFEGDELQKILPPDEVARKPSNLSIDEFTSRAMTTLADYLALSVERIVADRVTRAVAEVRRLGGRVQSKSDFLRGCLEIIKRSTCATAGTVFLETADQQRLIEAASTGLKWMVKEPYYGPDQGLVGRVWRQNLEFTLSREADRESDPLSEEVNPGGDYCTAFVPIRDTKSAGHCLGVLRCRNKRRRIGSLSPAVFTQSDITVMQAVCDAIVPRLQIYETEEQTRHAYRKMAHELKMPLTGMGMYLDLIEGESRRSQFSEDWIEEARSNIQLMGRQVAFTETVIRQANQEASREPFVRTLLLRDVVAPVRDQMRMYLRRKDLPPNSIELYDRKVDQLRDSGPHRWAVIPSLFVRRNEMQQIFFNLFANAIKYGWQNAAHFSIEVVPDRIGSEFAIHIRDFGIGVDPTEAGELFKLGFRGASAPLYDPYGHGYGLAISSELAREHDCRLECTRYSQPTVFTLFFPSYLEERPPSPKGKRK